jgi:hypothetical protein
MIHPLALLLLALAAAFAWGAWRIASAPDRKDG